MTGHAVPVVRSPEVGRDHHGGVRQGRAAATLKITPEKSTFWIARVPPYTNRHLEDLRSRLRRHKAFHEEIIGKS
jgi:hypothetical protein